MSSYPHGMTPPVIRIPKALHVTLVYAQNLAKRHFLLQNLGNNSEKHEKVPIFLQNFTFFRISFMFSPLLCTLNVPFWYR